MKKILFDIYFYVWLFLSMLVRYWPITLSLIILNRFIINYVIKKKQKKIVIIDEEKD